MLFFRAETQENLQQFEQPTGQIPVSLTLEQSDLRGLSQRLKATSRETNKQTNKQKTQPLESTAIG